MNGVKNEIHSEDESSSQINDSQLTDILQQLETYTPTIPDSVAEHYLKKAGINTDDTRIIRLISTSAQKFISDILNDALQTNKMKGYVQNSRSSKSKDKKLLLTLDDLAPVLAERGIKVKKPIYYT